jgi:uncharacterized protein YecT (DUF1311 family)
LPLRVLIFLLTLVILSNKAIAEDCTEKTGPDAVACVSAAYAASDRQLNLTYKSLIETLRGNSSKVNNLIQDERAWIKKRDADCRELPRSFDLNPSDFSYSETIIECQRHATETRTEQLKSYGR